MFKAKQLSLPVNIQSLFNSQNEFHYVTRQHGLFRQKFTSSNLKSMCLSVKGVKLWNVLPRELTNCKNIVSFKKMYKALIFNKYTSM